MTDFFILGWTLTLRILLGQFLHTSSKSYVCWKRDSTHQSHLNPLNATMCPISETNAEWHAETIKSCGWPAAGSPLLNPPHPFFRLFFFSLSSTVSPTFKPCQGEGIGSKMIKVKGGKRSRARPSAFQKHTLWEYQHALEHGEPTRCWRAITAHRMVSKSPTALLEHKGDDTRMDDLPWLAGTAACIRFPVKVTRQ